MPLNYRFLHILRNKTELNYIFRLFRETPRHKRNINIIIFEITGID